MPILYNNQNQKWEAVNDDVVNDGILSGQYSPRRGARMPVISPDGKIGDIASEELQIAMKNGYRYLGMKDEKNIREEQIKNIWKEEFDAPGVALAAGAARGLTFGLSDVAMRAVGGKDVARGLQITKEVSPIASTVGEITGGIVGLGKFGIGKGAAELGTKATSKIIAKYGEKSLMAQAAKAGAGSAIEGLAMGAGSVVSEAALGDPNMSIQHAATVLGMNTILGGGIGAFTKAGTMGVSKLINALKESTLPTATADKIGKVYSSLTPILRGLNEEEKAVLKNTFTTQSGRAKALKGIENRDAFEAEVKSNIGALKELGQTIKEFSMNARAASREELGAFTALNVRKKVATQLTKSIDNGLKEIEKMPEFFDADVAPSLNRIKSIISEQIPKAKTKQALHETVEEARKLIDEKMQFAEFARRGKGSRSEKLLQSIRGDFKEHLTDRAVYGNFADEYEKINQAYSAYSAMEKNFIKNFGEKTVDAMGKTVMDISPAKVAAFVRSPQKMTNLAKEANLEGVRKTLDNLTSVATSTGKADAQVAKDLLDKLTLSKSAIDNVLEDRNVAMILNSLETRTGKTLIGAGAGMLLGQATGLDPTGGLAGFVLGSALATPASMLKILTRIENLGMAGLQKNQNTIANFLNRPSIKYSSKLADAQIPKVTLVSLVNILDEKQHDKTPTMNQIRDLIDINVKQPEKVLSKFADANPMVDQYAPGYAAAAANTANRALVFLQSKLPKMNVMDINPTQELRMSKSSMQAFETYVDAAMRPARLHEELKKKSPDPRVIEAVQMVYPELFESLRNDILTEATSGKLTYQQKLTLGTLFAVSTTPSMKYMGNLQKNFMTPAEQPKTPRLTQKSLATIGQTATVTDRLQM